MKAFQRSSILDGEWIIHLPFWLGWIIIMNAGESNGFGYYTQLRHNLLWPLIISTAFNVLFFYGNALWLLPKFYKSDQVWKYLLALSIFSVIFIFGKTAAEKLYIWFYLKDLESIPFRNLVRENIYSYPILCLTSIIFFRYRKNKIERDWLTRERLNQELALMKAQISPHFLFNALNNLYSLGVQGNHSMVSNGILKLSDLLRYMIYESSVEEILLRKELNYIGDFVEVNKLMLKKDDLEKVKYSIQGNPAGLKIPPMLLVNFVENAFKYGTADMEDIEINIAAEIEKNQLTFVVCNKISNTTIQISSESTYSGFGLSNVRKRLELIFKNKYKLNVQKQNGYFKTKLEIELTL